MGPRDNQEFGYTRKRDLTSLVALIGPVVLVTGVIGTWYLLGYRVDRLEKSIEKVSNTLEYVRDEQIRRAEWFERINRDYERCCNQRRRLE